MVEGPFLLGFVVVQFDWTAAPISSVAAESVRPIHSAPYRTVDQVRADRDVEAANCSGSLFDDAHTAREVGLALSGSTVMCPATMTMGALQSCRLRVQPAGLFR
jgi:hypothetical protein